MDFVIHYGLAAGFEDEALALARRLFADFDDAIDSLALIPIDENEFDLFLNGSLIHSYQRSGRAPRLADLSEMGTLTREHPYDLDDRKRGDTEAHGRQPLPS